MRIPIACTVVLLGCSGVESSPVDVDAGSLDGGASDAAATDAGPPPRDAAWVALGGTPGGEGRWGSRLVYVEHARRFVLFGGSRYPMGGALGDLWMYGVDDDTWTVVPAGGAIPPPRYCHCMTYLPTTGEVLLVGGRDSGGPLPPAAYVLDLDGLQWTQIDGPAPPGVIGCAVEWMPSIDRAIVFGGGTRTELPTETWAYDPIARAFAQVATSTSPPGRADPESAYDAERQRILLFGGGVRAIPPFEHRDDTWAFDGTDWVRIEGPGPSARRFPAGALDPAGRAWFVFSGTIESEDPPDLWRFDLDRDLWTEIDSTEAPDARGFAAAAWDPTSDSMIMFGGLTQPVVRARTDGWRFVTPR